MRACARVLRCPAITLFIYMLKGRKKMIRNIVKHMRVKGCLKEMMQEGRCFWWTFTTSDVVDYQDISKRWRKLRHWLNEKYPCFKYVQNFELHPRGHGWHIHMVCNAFINLKNKHVRFMITKFGFSRVSCSLVNDDGISEYLTKHAMKAYRSLPDRVNKRFRLVNVSRNCDYSLSKFVVVGGLTDSYKEHLSNCPAHDRTLVILAVKHGFLV